MERPFGGIPNLVAPFCSKKCRNFCRSAPSKSGQKTINGAQGRSHDNPIKFSRSSKISQSCESRKSLISLLLTEGLRVRSYASLALKKYVSLVPFVPTVSIEPAKLILPMVRVSPVESFVAPTFRSAFGQMSGGSLALRAQNRRITSSKRRQLTTLMDCFFSTTEPDK